MAELPGAIGMTGGMGPSRRQAVIDCPICGIGAEFDIPETVGELSDLLVERALTLAMHCAIDHEIQDHHEIRRLWAVQSAVLRGVGTRGV